MCRLGYVQVNYVAAFKEIEFELVCYTNRQDCLGGSAGPGEADNSPQYSEAMMRIMEYTQDMHIHSMDDEESEN